MLQRKTFWGSCVALIMTIGVTAPAFAQPLNDNCVDAEIILIGDTAYTTVDATTDGLELDPAVCDPGGFGDDQIHRDIWFLFTAPDTATYTMTTCGQVDYDSRLAVYNQTLCPDDPANVIACNDDGPAATCPGFSSELSVDLTAGTEYLVRVGGFSDADTGSGTLTITSAPPVENLQCADQGFGAGVADITWDAGLFDDINIYVDGNLEATLPGSDVSFSTAPNPGPFPVTIEVCVEGVVGGVAGVQSCCTVELLDVPLANDECDFAEVILVGDTAFDTNSATTDGVDLTGICDPGPFGDEQIYNDIWYVFTPTETGVWTVSTCNQADFDTRLAIYDGTDCTANLVIACDDDGPPAAACAGFTSELGFDGVAGQDYLIRVGGFNDAERGTGTLTISEPPIVATPTDVLCTDSGCSTLIVTWNDAASYDSVNIFLDGALIGTAAAGDGMFETDPLALPAVGEICVEGQIGADVSPQACCSFAINSPCPVPDAVLSQSTDPATITPLNSVSCNAAGLHADNSYWRSYDLAAGINITGVEFGIEDATAGPLFDTQPAVVRLYTDPTPGDPAPVADLILLREVTFEVGDAAAEIFCIGIDPPESVAGGTTLVVELFTPDGQADGHSFFIGSNAAGQSGISYLSAAACGLAEPGDTASIGFADMHIILNVLDGGTVGANPEVCDNGLDDDCDGLVDCADSDCSGDPICAGTGDNFRRGDANGDGGYDISDAIFTLAALFTPGSPSPSCADTGDSNDDGGFDISDAIYTLAALFQPGSPPPSDPGPTTCGPDPTDDGLDCADYPACP